MDRVLWAVLWFAVNFAFFLLLLRAAGAVLEVIESRFNGLAEGGSHVFMYGRIRVYVDVLEVGKELVRLQSTYETNGVEVHSEVVEVECGVGRTIFFPGPSFPWQGIKYTGYVRRSLIRRDRVLVEFYYEGKRAKSVGGAGWGEA